MNLEKQFVLGRIWVDLWQEVCLETENGMAWVTFRNRQGLGQTLGWKEFEEEQGGGNG